MNSLEPCRVLVWVWYRLSLYFISDCRGYTSNIELQLFKNKQTAVYIQLYPHNVCGGSSLIHNPWVGQCLATKCHPMQIRIRSRQSSTAKTTMCHPWTVHSPSFFLFEFSWYTGFSDIVKNRFLSSYLNVIFPWEKITVVLRPVTTRNYNLNRVEYYLL